MSLTSFSVAYARTRMPSYFGSKVQPFPGTSLPMLAYIGSSAAAANLAWEADSVVRGDATSRALFALGLVIERARLMALPRLGSRLLLQIRPFPDAISSMVRPESTEVM